MKTALITGASRGIGLGIAKELAKKGFAIAMNGFSESDDLHKACESIQKLGGKAMIAPFDVANIDHHEDEIKNIENRLGELCCLVNNAGVGVLNRGDILEVTETSYDRCFAINTKALFFLSQTFAKLLVNRKSQSEAFQSIINVTSANASAVAVNRAEYCASKAAAAMVSKTFAARLGAENIAVYDIQPGLINTDMTSAVIDSYAQRAKEGLTLIPRVGQPKDIGRVAATLACGNLPYTTGQVISVDGGLLVNRF